MEVLLTSSADRSTPSSGQRQPTIYSDIPSSTNQKPKTDESSGPAREYYGIHARARGVMRAYGRNGDKGKSFW